MPLVRIVLRRRLEILVAIAASTVISTALLLHGSVPSVRHDWQWPVLSGTFVALAHLKVDAWWWQGFGSPSIAAQLHPFFVLPSLAAGILSPYATLVLVCILIWSAASGGMVALLRDRFGVNGAGSVAGAAAYAFAPLVVVKMVAGHLAFLVAYAAIPLALWSAMGLEFSAAVLLAAALAIASVQLQVFALALGLVVLFRRLPVHYVAASIAIAICTATPHLWSLLRPGASVVTQGMITSRPWELSLSSPIGPALVGLGYFEPYWHQATASHFMLDRFLPATYAIGIAGVVCSVSCAFRFRLVAVYALGVALVAGLLGPLSAPLSYAFLTFPAFSALRELYDMALLIVFSGSCAFAIIVSRLPARGAWTIALVTSAIAILPWMDGLVLGQTSRAPVTADLSVNLDSISAATPWSRLLILPPVNPSGSDAGTSAGADPLALPYRTLTPLWIYLASGFEPDYLWMLARQSKEIDTNLGVSAAIAHTHFSLRQLGPTILTMNSTSYSNVPLVPRGARAERVSTDLMLYRINDRAQILQLVPKRFPAVIEAKVRFQSERGADPRVTSAPIIDYWYLSKQLAQGAPSGAFTLARESSIKVSCSPLGRKVKVAILGAGFYGSTRVSASSWQNEYAYCEHYVNLRPRPLLAITSRADIDNSSAIENVLRARRLPVNGLVISGDVITGSVQPCKRCSLLLMEKFDPGWTMIGPNLSRIEPHDVGGFNEWDLDSSEERTIRVSYDPAHDLSIAVDFSGVAWSVIGLGLVTVCVGAIAPRK
jgi:hypothetical protein